MTADAAHRAGYGVHNLCLTSATSSSLCKMSSRLPSLSLVTVKSGVCSSVSLAYTSQADQQAHFVPGTVKSGMCSSVARLCRWPAHHSQISRRVCIGDRKAWCVLIFVAGLHSQPDQRAGVCCLPAYDLGACRWPARSHQSNRRMVVASLLVTSVNCTPS